MRSVPTIAPGAEALNLAGGIEFEHRASAGLATCKLCGEWQDLPNLAEFNRWARRHARETHDAMRTSVLGLDLSLTRTGIAVSSLDPARGSYWPSLLTHAGEAGSEHATYDERGDRLGRQVDAVLGYVDDARRQGADIRLAGIEGPIYFGKILPSFYDRAYLFWAVYRGLRARRIPVAVITPDHRAMFICGVKPPSGPNGKKLVLAESRKRWAEPRLDVNPDKLIANHDQADALGMAEMCVLAIRGEVPWRVQRRHAGNVALVTWPAVTL